MMKTTINGRLAATALCGLAALTLAGCGSKVSGHYTTSGGGAEMNFKSGGKVEITMMGMTQEADYAVEDDKVKITTGRQTQILPIDDKGCLKGGFLLGTLCKKA